MRRVGLTALMLTLIALCPAVPHGHAVADTVRRVVINGAGREYRVHTPLGFDNTQPYPVVLAFHGGASDADTMVAFSALNTKSDAAGFIAVYPSGSGRVSSMLTWNAGNCCGYAMEHRVDDVTFVRRLLDDLAGAYRIDQNRVYATGMSNGAMFTHRIGAELADVIAAIAPVSGPLGLDAIRPARPIAVMHFHGTADDHAPYNGGHGKRSLTPTNFRSVAQTMAMWARANGCADTPTTTTEPDRANDGMTVTRSNYQGCRDRSEVVLFTIAGGGHTWPGTAPARRIAPLLLGPVTRDISANDLMWDFFLRHSLR